MLFTAMVWWLLLPPGSYKGTILGHRESHWTKVLIIEVVLDDNLNAFIPVENLKLSAQPDHSRHDYLGIIIYVQKHWRWFPWCRFYRASSSKTNWSRMGKRKPYADKQFVTRFPSPKSLIGAAKSSSDNAGKQRNERNRVYVDGQTPKLIHTNNILWSGFQGFKKMLTSSLS